MNENINKMIDIYFEKTDRHRNPNSYTFLFNQIATLMNIGHNPKTIEQAIIQDALNFKSLLKLEDKIKKDVKVKSQNYKDLNGNNLIVKGKFYFHPFLLNITGPKITIDKDGNFIEEHIPQEPKEVVTYDDLLEYYQTLFPYNNIKSNSKRDLAGLEYLYKGIITEKMMNGPHNKVNELDLLLFTMYAAKAELGDKDIKLNNALDLADFVDKGLEQLLMKITEISYSVGDKTCGI